MVCVDDFLGTLYLDEPREIELYEAAWNSIWNTALDVEPPRQFLTH
jgi:hypothetical protein